MTTPTPTPATVYTLTYTGDNFPTIAARLRPHLASITEEEWAHNGESGKQLVFSPRPDEDNGVATYRERVGATIRYIHCDEKGCGRLDFLRWNEPLCEYLIAHRRCFYCNHWHKLMAVVDDPKTVRIGGVHYRLGDERGPAQVRGYGGRRFRIKFHDGRDVTTTDLWCQGTIPQRFRERLGDNAVFVRDQIEIALRQFEPPIEEKNMNEDDTTLPDLPETEAGSIIEPSLLTPEDRARLRPGDRLGMDTHSRLYIIRDAHWDGSTWPDAVSLITLGGYGVKRFKDYASCMVALAQPSGVLDEGELPGDDDPRESGQEQREYRQVTE